VKLLRSTFSRPADNTAYQAGDEISNHATAGSVVRATFDLSGFTRGRVLSAALDVEAASGNVVTTASDFELLIFRTPDAPAAVGDNVTHPISAETRAKAVARFRFDDAGWTNPLGAVAAGTSQAQAVMPTKVQPLGSPVLEYPHPGFPFTFEGQTLAQRELTAVLRTLGAWTPTGIVNTFGISLSMELA
jgi:hypothetical protein